MKPKKSILLISYYFAPNNIVGAKRISYLSYYLSKMEYQVSILTVKEKYNIQKDESQIYSGDIHRAMMIFPFPVKGKNIFQKIYKRIWETIYLIDPHTGWTLPAIIKGIKIIKKKSIEMIIASGPPFNSFFIAYILSRITGVKFIIDYRDPWFLYSSRSKFYNKKLNRWLEDLILKSAHKVVFNTEKSRNEYLNRKKIESLKNKSVVIKNALSLNYELEPFILEKDKKVILYAGNFYGKRSLQYLIEPLQRFFNEGLLNPEDVAIHVFGRVPEKDKKCLSQFNLLSLLTEHNKVCSDDIIRYMKGADILYLPQGGNVRYSIAFKFYDYLSAKKPILAVTNKNSATAEIMRETDCGEIADIEKPDEIYFALKNIFIEKKKFSFRNLEEYTWENISRKFSCLIENHLNIT